MNIHGRRKRKKTTQIKDVTATDHQYSSVNANPRGCTDQWVSARRNKGTEYCLLHGKGVTLTAATRVSRSAESAAILDPYYALEPKSINL